MYISVNKVIEIRWILRIDEDYGFDQSGRLYNLKTSRKIKLTYNNRSKGWWIKKRWLSKSSLDKTMIKRPEDWGVPF